MVSKTCLKCNTVFTRPKRLGFKLWSKRVFCNRQCADFAKKGATVSKRTTKNCQNCDKPFEVLPHRIKAKFCSQSCLAKSKIGENGKNWQGGKPECLDCKVTLVGYKQKRCRSCSNIFRSGENNSAWKGGITPLVRSIRTMMKYNEWRKSVYERDNYTCQECKLVGVALNADHIKPFSKMVRQSKVSSIKEAGACRELWDIDNGRTLCVDCHKKTDTFGYKSSMSYLLNDKTILCH